MTDGTELEWLERLDPPAIHAATAVHHQVLEPRFVVSFSKSAKRKQHMEYLGKSSAVVRPGVRVTPRGRRVCYSWDVDVPDRIERSLRARAARVGYLGAADSPVRMRVRARCGTEFSDDGAFVPDPEGALDINVPAEGDLLALDGMFRAWEERGPSVSRDQFPSLDHRVRYRPPGWVAPVDRGAVVAWLRLSEPVSGRRVSAVTDLLKKAVLARHQALHGEPSPILHGHGYTKSGFDLARFLALPDVGFRHSRGRIHGVAVWLPPDCDRMTVSSARDAALSVRRLTGHGLDIDVFPWAGEATPVAATPRRWTERGRSWVTAFPAVHERHRPLDLTEVARWCTHAGLPGPVAFRSTRSPLVRGAVDLSPVEANRPGRRGRPYSHIQVWFSEPVGGPVVLGGARQRGLGLCVRPPGRKGTR